MAFHPEENSLTKFYLQRAPLSTVLEEAKLSESKLDINWQTEFLCDTLNHPLSMDFPPAVPYRRSLVKKIMKEIGRQGEEISEELMEAAGLVMSQANTEFGFKTFILEKSFVTILESELLVSNGTTGLQTWSASLRLAEYFMNNPEILRDKRVLELGSGIGLMGLILCTECRPEQFIFTDFHSSVLEKLAQNISLNHGRCANLQCYRTIRNDPKISQYSESANIDTDKQRDWISRSCENCGFLMCHKQRGELEWSRMTRDDLERFNYNVVVAADVIYDIDIVPYFLKALRIIFEVTSDMTVYVANTIRKPETMKAFIDGLDGLQLSVKVKSLHTGSSLYYSASHVHVIHCITSSRR